MLSVAIGWHLYQLTGNPFDLALVGLVQVIPAMLLFIVTGMVVDHFPRKLVLVSCVAVQTVLLVVLSAVMHSESLDRFMVFSMLFLSSCVTALYRPAIDAVLPNLVEKSFLQRAIAISTTVWTVASTAGPFVAGVLLAILDFDVYWIMVVLAGLSTLFFLLLPSLQHVKPSGRGIEQLLGGIKFVKSSPMVLGGISLDLFIVLTGSVMALLPVYATDILQVGPEALGFLRGMPALGAVMVGTAMAKLPEMRSSGKCLFVALLIFSLSILVFAFSSSLWLSLAALFVYGASDMVSVNVRSSMIQLATPENLRGRVNAVNSLFISMSNQLGDFRAGSVAAAASPVITVALGGVCALGIAAAGYALFPSIRKLDRISDIQSKKSE